MAASRVGVVTEEEKQLLLERYLDIVWIDDVTESKCVRCDRVPIHHYVSNCLHLYCRNCRTVFSDGGQWKCPLCKEYVTQLSDQHWELEDHIYQIRAHCPNKKYGCHYQGQLSTIPGHLRSCKDTREAALPAEFKGITLDTVVNQIMRLNGVVEAIQGEVRALRVESEQKWMPIETVEMKLDELTNSIKVLTQDFNDQKEICDNVKPINEERVLSGAVEIQQLRTQLQQQQTLIDTNTEQNENQLTRLNVSMEAMQSEVKETRDNYEQLKDAMDELSSDLLNKRPEWAHAEPLLKDMKEFRDQSETNWKQMKEINDDLTKDLKMLRWDLHEQKQQLVEVKPILNDVNELKDNYKSNMDQTQQLETKVDWLSSNINIIVKDLSEQKEQLANVEQHMTDANELRVKCEINWKQAVQMHLKLDEWTTNTQVLTQEINDQKQQLANVTHAVKDMKELRDECESYWEQYNKYNEDSLMDLKILKWDQNDQKKQLANVNALITDVKDKCETNCDHIKTMEIKVDELVSNAQVLTQGLDEQSGQLTNVQQLLQDNGSSAAVEIEKLKSQLEQQATLINTNNTQGAGEIKKLNVTVEAMQREVMDQRANWQSNRSEEKVQRVHLSRDLDDLKLQLVEARDRRSRDADDIQYLMCQFETSVHTLVNRCQVNIKGKQLMMAQTQHSANSDTSEEEMSEYKAERLRKLNTCRWCAATRRNRLTLYKVCAACRGSNNAKPVKVIDLTSDSDDETRTCTQLVNAEVHVPPSAHTPGVKATTYIPPSRTPVSAKKKTTPSTEEEEEEDWDKEIEEWKKGLQRIGDGAIPAHEKISQSASKVADADAIEELESDTDEYDPLEESQLY